MTSDTVVLDVSRDWATACDVQERFMQHTGPAVFAELQRALPASAGAGWGLLRLYAIAS